MKFLHKNVQNFHLVKTVVVFGFCVFHQEKPLVLPGKTVGVARKNRWCWLVFRKNRWCCQEKPLVLLGKTVGEIFAQKCAKFSFG